MEASGGSVRPDKPSPKPLQNLRPNPMNHLVSSKPVTVIRKEFDLGKNDNKSGANENTALPAKVETVPHSSRRKSKLVATPDVPYKNGHTPASSPLSWTTDWLLTARALLGGGLLVNGSMLLAGTRRPDVLCSLLLLRAHVFTFIFVCMPR